MSTSSRPEPDGTHPTHLSVGQTITVFRSRLRPESSDEYGVVAKAMEAAVRSIPGFVDAKTFTADDGERVTVATFADRDALESWRDHEGHREAQRRGRGSCTSSTRSRRVRASMPSSGGPTELDADRLAVASNPTADRPG